MKLESCFLATHDPGSVVSDHTHHALEIVKPQLVLIEGAPGLGKTTAVTNLAKSLEQDRSIKFVFCHEHDHPLHAFWTWGDGYDPDEVIVDPFSARKFIVRLLARTYGFVDQLLSEQSVAIMETYPFQSPVRNLLKMLGTEQDCSEYFNRFCDAVAFCNPLLVYFEYDSWRERILQIAEERGDKFNDLFFNAFYGSPWGRMHSARSPGDVVSFYEYYLNVCDRLLGDWPFRLVRFNPIELGRDETVGRILTNMGKAPETPGSASSSGNTASEAVAGGAAGVESA